ncbi:type II toxin-antitoxin system PemK/MazF family toxin [Actinomadura rubrisoli]|uniref:type II toxin-antitoxin system PemK/MazF family toxin n=1 Tax=Actinomadura rubrisoli TaxID=2530368 RepID=UPI0014054804|nr:type II toxin-antitoxin system PemK/MazF family toxin [Actinomadura rubrisoli]
MRRGEVWIVGSRVSGRDQYVLIVGNDLLVESLGSVITVGVEAGEAFAGASMVTVQLTQPFEGTVRAHWVTTVRKDRFERMVGMVDRHTMDVVDAALRAALDL